MSNEHLNQAIARTERSRTMYARRRVWRARMVRLQNLWRNTLQLATPRQGLVACLVLIAAGLVIGWLAGAFTTTPVPVVTPQKSDLPMISCNESQPCHDSGMRLKMSTSLSQPPQ